MRVSLIHPPVEVGLDYMDYPIFAGLGTWHAAARLGACGHEVRVLDAFCLPEAGYAPTPEGGRFGVAPDAFLAALEPLADAQVFVVALDPFAAECPHPDPTWRRTLAHLKRLAPRTPCLLADLAVTGMHYFAYEETTLAPDADVLLRYEAEVSLPAALEALAAGHAPPKVVHGEPAPAALLDTGAAYERWPREAYRAFLAKVLEHEPRANPFGITAGSLPVTISRGCAYACRFCMSNTGGRRGLRALPPAAVRGLVERLAADTALDTLVVLDNANQARASFLALLTAARAANLALAFPNGLRADHLDDEMVDGLAAVCRRLSLSPESGSDSFLARAVDKRQSLAEVERVAAAAQRAGLPLALHFMVGWPGETARELHATFATAARLWERYGAEPWVQFAVPMPGTPLYDEAQRGGWLPSSPPASWMNAFGRAPLLKDGACGLPNATLVRLRDALERHTRRL